MERRVTRVLEAATPVHNRVDVERLDRQPLRSPYVDFVLTANSPMYRAAITRGFESIRDGLFTVEPPRTEPLADEDGVTVRNQETVVVRAWRRPPGMPRAYSAKILLVLATLAALVLVYMYLVTNFTNKLSSSSSTASTVSPQPQPSPPAPYQPSLPAPPVDDHDHLYAHVFNK